MAIENSVSNGFLYLHVSKVLTFSIAAYSVWDVLHEKNISSFLPTGRRVKIWLRGYKTFFMLN